MNLFVNPALKDLLIDWLKEQNSEWVHLHEITWKRGGTSGEITNKLNGFLMHPLSQHLGEVLWISDDNVWVPMGRSGQDWSSERLMAADPEFFAKLAQAMEVMAYTFVKHPDRNKPETTDAAFVSAYVVQKIQ